MIVVKNKIIPFGTYTAINLFGIVFTKENLNDIHRNHEAIHSVQIFECTVLSVIFITFLILVCGISWEWILLSIPMYYIQYGLEYVLIRVFHKKQNDAYHDVSFEEEAYSYENDSNYLYRRKCFAWVKYLKLRSYGKS